MPTESPPLRIAMVPGVSVSKWTTAWRERRRNSPLSVTPIDESQQVSVLHENVADVSFVRLPIERDELSVIRLYSEVAVVVVPKEHPIALYESVTLAELAGEVVRSEPAADAVEIIAAGAGVILVPHSVARQYGRKDVVAVPISDAEETEIAIAWLAENTTPDIEEFVGIVRGRRPGSSRGQSRAEPEPENTKAGARAASTAAAKKGGSQGGTESRSGGKARAKPAAKRPPKSKARGRKKTGRN